MTPFYVEDSVPDEDEVDESVRRLLMKCSGGLLGMRVEHLHKWLGEATSEVDPYDTH